MGNPSYKSLLAPGGEIAFPSDRPLQLDDLPLAIVPQQLFERMIHQCAARLNARRPLTLGHHASSRTMLVLLIGATSHPYTHYSSRSMCMLRDFLRMSLLGLHRSGRPLYIHRDSHRCPLSTTHYPLFAMPTDSAQNELPKQYDHAAAQARWYPFWEERGYFHSEPNPARKPYTIVIPPPNVTGALHLGHALNNTLQDILIRQKRMQGFETLWLPGTDHAGIATQAVVERRLLAEEKLSRHELGRQGLVDRIWQWKRRLRGPHHRPVEADGL